VGVQHHSPRQGDRSQEALLPPRQSSDGQDRHERQILLRLHFDGKLRRGEQMREESARIFTGRSQNHRQPPKTRPAPNDKRTQAHREVGENRSQGGKEDRREESGEEQQRVQERRSPGRRQAGGRPTAPRSRLPQARSGQAEAVPNRRAAAIAHRTTEEPHSNPRPPRVRVQAEGRTQKNRPRARRLREEPKNRPGQAGERPHDDQERTGRGEEAARVPEEEARGRTDAHSGEKAEGQLAVRILVQAVPRVLRRGQELQVRGGAHQNASVASEAVVQVQEVPRQLVRGERAARSVAPLQHVRQGGSGSTQQLPGVADEAVGAGGSQEHLAFLPPGGVEDAPRDGDEHTLLVGTVLPETVRVQLDQFLQQRTQLLLAAAGV
jgi:hypothetical protein